MLHFQIIPANIWQCRVYSVCKRKGCENRSIIFYELFLKLNLMATFYTQARKWFREKPLKPQKFTFDFLVKFYTGHCNVKAYCSSSFRKWTLNM